MLNVGNAGRLLLTTGLRCLEEERGQVRRINHMFVLSFRSRATASMCILVIDLEVLASEKYRFGGKMFSEPTLRGRVVWKNWTAVGKGLLVCVGG